MLVRLIAVAVAVKAVPFASVMNTPPDPAVAVIVPAAVWMGAPAAPMPLDPAAGVVRIREPVPALRRLPAAWLIEPPVVLAPGLVRTVILPPDPVVMFPRAASRAPPPAAFTLIATALLTYSSSMEPAAADKPRPRAIGVGVHRHRSRRRRPDGGISATASRREVIAPLT
jgi:hypothetical protein